MHGFTCLKTFLAQQDGVQQLWPLGLSLTRSYYDDFNFGELLSDLATIARMIHPRLGSRLVSARLTFGVHCCILPREERCARRTNPVKSERTGADACLSTLHSNIDPSELAAKGVLRARRLCCLRRETASESAVGSSEAGFYRSPFCTSSRRGADRRWGFGASLYYRVAGDGQVFPTRERYRGLD